MLAGCASGSTLPPDHRPAPLAPLNAPTQPLMPVVTPNATATISGFESASSVIRKDLLERARAALDIHGHRIVNRDRMYLVDFQKFSGYERFYEVDLEAGLIRGFRTSHGRGSDPRHSGYAQDFSNRPDSHMSSLGAFVTAGPNWGPQQGPNVLLDGMEYTNNLARERAIIVHGADYAEPSFLERQGKLGRSYGCFSVSHGDLTRLRERMGEGRLVYSAA